MLTRERMQTAATVLLTLARSATDFAPSARAEWREIAGELVEAAGGPVPGWAAEPLRAGEYEVPVFFRVTASSAQAAREKCRRIAEWGGEGFVTSMYVPGEAAG